MDIREHEPLGPKTTMRIGGTARYFAELHSRQDVDEAITFASSKKIPLIVLGTGSNTVFADGKVHALVVRIKANAVSIEESTVHIEAGKNLAELTRELAAHNLDLSALAGIPGTVGGALFGNAGQGPKGTWIDAFIEEVTVWMDGGWKTLRKQECLYRYRESAFKDHAPPVLLWSAVLRIPARPKKEILEEIERCLRKRFESQVQAHTAGSCFKALADGTPAWNIIAAAGLKGARVGGVEISPKHANFLVNTGSGTFADLCALVKTAKKKAPALEGIEMRLYGNDGKLIS
ncbi:MAG: FAD-binding protein [Candidatus Peregrinibacteria bacterium]